MTAIPESILPKSLSLIEVGPLNQSILTTANRVLRLYVFLHDLQGKEDHNLRLQCKFIVECITLIGLWLKQNSNR